MNFKKRKVFVHCIRTHFITYYSLASASKLISRFCAVAYSRFCYHSRTEGLSLNAMRMQFFHQKHKNLSLFCVNICQRNQRQGQRKTWWTRWKRAQCVTPDSLCSKKNFWNPYVRSYKRMRRWWCTFPVRPSVLGPSLFWNQNTRNWLLYRHHWWSLCRFQ